LDHTPDAVVVVSADAHVSWQKAARVMGLQNDAVREIPVDGQGRIDLQQLEDELTALSREGRPCITVVATAGTTVRGAIDPVSALADLCSRLGRWLHVDGAIGAVFALSPTSTHLLDGIARADSITVNPQKVLGITKTSSLLLVRNPSVLAEAFSTGLPYMEPALEHDHGGELGLQGSRPAEVLKLWLGLRQLGESGIEQVLSAAIARREYLQQQLDPNRLMILSGPLHVLACRPQRGQAQQHESWSIETRLLLLSQGIMVSRPLHQGRHHLKAVLGNPHTHDGLLDQLASALNQSVEVRP
jgi:sulfinoalanine decarboxylase